LPLSLWSKSLSSSQSKYWSFFDLLLPFISSDMDKGFKCSKDASIAFLAALSLDQGVLPESFP